ncbi:MAG: hypothetical protein IPK82_02645 [Polyangiaceae bacterium]|nr:hypothetical protein [Polyangiaceae bacterium]
MTTNLSCCVRLGLLVLAIGVWGCGAIAGDNANQVTEGGGGSDVDTEAMLQLVCKADENIVFPPLAKGCFDVSQCVLIFHRVDCCKTANVYSINQLAQAEFDDVEGLCSQAFGTCGCKSFPYTVEDGNEVTNFANLAVKCEEGACKAYVVPE